MKINLEEVEFKVGKTVRCNWEDSIIKFFKRLFGRGKRKGE